MSDSPESRPTVIRGQIPRERRSIRIRADTSITAMRNDSLMRDRIVENVKAQRGGVRGLITLRIGGDGTLPAGAKVPRTINDG